MSWTLAITGKGGVGKTTLAALAARWLIEHNYTPVLAVDADPNICLDTALGVKVAHTVGGAREAAKRIAQADSAGGMSKQELLDLKIQESLIESEKFDLIAMGRPEGPGCYCYANNVLRSALERLAEHYAAVVIDNEAGLENLSRRTVQRADWLVFVTEPTARGTITARRLYDLALEMQVNARAMGVVVNRLREYHALERAREAFANTPVAILGGIPENAELASQDSIGSAIFTLSAENAAYLAAAKIMATMWLLQNRALPIVARASCP